MKPTNIFFYLLILLLLTPSSAHAVSLQQALVLSYKNNPELLIERERIKSTHEMVPQAYSGWLPTASVDFDKGQETVKLGGARANSNDVTNTGFSITQPIFDGFNTVSSTDKAYFMVDAATAELQQREQEVLLKTVNVYVDLVESKEILILNKKNENVLREQLEATEATFELGATTRTDVAQAEARLAAATSTKIESRANLESAIASYKKVIGEEPGDSVLPKMLPWLPKSPIEAKDLSLENNPQIKKVRYENEAAKEDVTISKSALLPELDLVGSATRSDGASTFGSGKVRNDSVLLSLSIPLYQSGSEYSKIRQAKIDERQKEYEIRDVETVIIEEASKNWNDLKSARSIIKSNIAAVKAAKIALDGVRSEQEQGSRTVLDVLDAEQELFEAEVNLVKAKSNEIRFAYALKSTIGQLSMASLGINAELFDPNANLEDVKFKMIGF